MDKRLEELRKQRDLIQQHLDWIDRQLAQADNRTSTEAPQSNEPQDTEPLTPETKNSGEAPPESSSETAHIDVELERMAPPLHNDVFKAKIGCLALFILGVGGFLFLLFGLPYLLD